jgi:hypothetical protein
MDLSNNIFPILILNARPAAGKSETIRYLASIPLEPRAARFHIGPVKVIDDFPILWGWFEEDDLLEKVFSHDRLHSTSDYYFKDHLFWNVLIRRISLDYEKTARDTKGPQTVILEFSRGAEHGGYKSAYAHLSDQILSQCATMYVNVSFEESQRKNLRRRNPERLDSSLEHSLESEKLSRLYREDDWPLIAPGTIGQFQIREYSIPYVTFENEDDVTTPGGDPLGERLEAALSSLWTLWVKTHSIESSWNSRGE